MYDASVHPLLTNLLDGRTLLLAVAAPVEVRGVMAGLGRPDTPVPRLWEAVEVGPQVHLLHTGVSKANAAGALGCALRDGHLYGGIVNLGIAGALPAGGLQVGHAVTATACVFGDEGLQTDIGFKTLAKMGFPLDPSLGSAELIPTDTGLQHVFRSFTDAAGVVATVSTCSGTDALAAAVVERTGAAAETMEGAALALVARRRRVPFCEVRTISNLTGNRASQRWDIKGAVSRLSDIVRAVIS